MLICQSIARAINRSISHFFFLFLSRNVPLCTSPFPFPLNGVSLCSKATSRQHRSPSFFQKHSVISIGFPCARAVLHRSIVSSSPCTVPYCAYVLSFFSPTKPSGSAPLVRPDDILLHRRVTHIIHPDRLDSELPSSLRSIFPRRPADFLARSLPSEAH